MTMAADDRKPILDMTVLQGLQAYARSAAFLPQLIGIFEDHGRTSLHELHHALLGRDKDAVRRIAHRFKGSCLNMGAQALATELRRFEGGQQEVQGIHPLEWPVEDLDSQYAELSKLFEETCRYLKSLN